jgi:hypothetical protein
MSACVTFWDRIRIYYLCFQGTVNSKMHNWVKQLSEMLERGIQLYKWTHPLSWLQNHENVTTAHLSVKEILQWCCSHLRSICWEPGTTLKLLWLCNNPAGQVLPYTSCLGNWTWRGSVTVSRPYYQEVGLGGKSSSFQNVYSYQDSPPA